jgi:hypothetical protein
LEAKVETCRRERASATRDLAQEKVASGDLIVAAKLEIDDRDLRIVQLQQHITQTAAANDEPAGIRGSRSACPEDLILKERVSQLEAQLINMQSQLDDARTERETRFARFQFALGGNIIKKLPN